MIPAGWAEWRALVEVVAIGVAVITTVSVWCMHRLRGPILALHKQLGAVAERIDTHEAEVIVPAVQALERLEVEVRGGFERNGTQHAELRTQHAELRDGMLEQGRTLTTHAAHLEGLDERTELLVRLVARSDA